MLIPLLLTAPWILIGILMAVGIRDPRPLPTTPAPAPGPVSPVAIVVPARNEEHNIGRCLASLAAQEYANFEILVVDDRSEDRTAEIVRSTPPRNARRIVLVEGRPLPQGWFGKPWACQQGAEATEAEVLLFTDADTIHAPHLLDRSVSALHEDRAGALSLVGRQLMETFWERLVQPHIFALIGMRYPGLHRPVDPARWRDAVANGQYMLMTRTAYDGVGGHAAVHTEVVEDIRMAQELARAGFRITVRGAEDAFSTRMYQNLRDLVQGWTKNMATGARQTAPGPLGSWAVPLLLLFLLVVWVLPPVVLLAGLAGLVGSGAILWAAVATFCGIAIWSVGSVKMRAPAVFGLLYPLGAGTTAFILVRSWMRGARRIEWKGRRYATGQSV